MTRLTGPQLALHVQRFAGFLAVSTFAICMDTVVVGNLRICPQLGAVDGFQKKKLFNFSFGFVFVMQTANHHKWRETYIVLLMYPTTHNKSTNKDFA